MQLDNQTLEDLSIFHREEEHSVFHKINFTKTDGGRDLLRYFLSNPFDDLPSILNTQQTIHYISLKIERWPVHITNGTIMMIERFFETSLSDIPNGSNFLQNQAYKTFLSSDYGIIRFSVTHFVDFTRGMQQLIELLDEDQMEACIRYSKLEGFAVKPTLFFEFHGSPTGVEEQARTVQEIAAENDVLVVSDAGMPTVSDPGFQLVRAAVEAGVEVTIIPGPSAVLSALAVSGLPTDRFTFEGFLPRKGGDRRKAFAALATETRTMVFFESPHRILESLEDAASQLGADRRATVSRELTKKFEHTERGTLAHLIEWAKTEPKGEMVLVIAGGEQRTVEAGSLVDQVIALAALGTGLKQAVAEIAAANGVSKSELYSLTLEARTRDAR